MARTRPAFATPRFSRDVRNGRADDKLKRINGGWGKAEGYRNRVAPARSIAKPMALRAGGVRKDLPELSNLDERLELRPFLIRERTIGVSLEQLVHAVSERFRQRKHVTH